jgi:hypothetical protein
MYTSHGLMTGEDYAEYLKDTDQGTTDVHLDDVPEWFEVPKTCPVCTVPPLDHDFFTVQDASGEIFACMNDSGDWRKLGDSE